MGVESTFACNMLKEVELGKKQAKVDSERFGSPMMSGVSHAQRPPRQRLRCVLGMLSSLEVKVLCPT
jgi:hypothetical protein